MFTPSNRPGRRRAASWPAAAALALGVTLAVHAASDPAVGDRAAARAAARAHLQADPALAATGPANAQVTARQRLGEKIFRDTSLSEPAGQSCASCHIKGHAFADVGATSAGADPQLFGPRNAPSITYAMFAPPLQAGGDEGAASYFGGQFRDGRANFLQDQAKGPMLNPIEMGNADAAAVTAKLAAATYAEDFKQIYGADIFANPDAAFTAMADAIAHFERTRLFARFDSKYDAYRHGKTTLSAAEARGLAIFEDPARGNCALCHITQGNGNGMHAVFTDFGYDNIGVPRNPANRFYRMPAQYNPDGQDYVDIGLANVVSRDYVRGQFKAPSLRNVAVTGPYTHNGYFKTLRGLIDFYNTRDVKPRCPNRFTSEADALAQGCWPVPEIPQNVNNKDMGNLHLSEQDVDDLVAFLQTLTDGWSAGSAASVGTTARGRK